VKTQKLVCSVGSILGLMQQVSALPLDHCNTFTKNKMFGNLWHFVQDGSMPVSERSKTMCIQL